MKTSYLKMAFTFLSLLIACSPLKNPPAKESNSVSDDWKEMEDFHMIMAESFHPYMDSSNLEPAKANAARLYELAQKWQSAPLPGKVNNDGVKQMLEQLKKEIETLTGQITAGNDKQIGASLTRMHDIFHELQSAWYRQ
jgi:hypothetical protein